MLVTVAIVSALVSVASSYRRFPGQEALCSKDPQFCDPVPELWLSLYGAAAAGRPADITWNKQAGGGKVFGTLGSTDNGLVGQAGYKGVIFDDARGKLEGQAHGTRVLSPNGDSSHLGGRLEWANENAKAALDVSKQIGGDTSVSATGAGKWALDKNTEVSAGGAVSHSGHGKPDVAVEAKIEHKF